MQTIYLALTPVEHAIKVGVLGHLLLSCLELYSDVYSSKFTLVYCRKTVHEQPQVNVTSYAKQSRSLKSDYW